MQDPLGYEGANVVVTGAASGMGAATARILVVLGATVSVRDVKETDIDGAKPIHLDLLDPAAIDAAVDELDPQRRGNEA